MTLMMDTLFDVDELHGGGGDEPERAFTDDQRAAID